VSDRNKDAGNGPSCPRCGAAMKDVVTIPPVADEPGLIAYECSKRGYVTSEFHYPQRNWTY
jgi:hypothetical protein